MSDLLKANSKNRIRSRDMFMIIALWMELYPKATPFRTSHSARPTGCVIVDAKDRIVSLACTGEAHAIVRAILKCTRDPFGCEVYVSRFPCSLCTKMMVQAGIRKIFYFPAKGLEIDWKFHQEMRERDGSPTRPLTQFHEKIAELEETNIVSVSRLVANNPMAMSKYIPSWTNEVLDPQGDMVANIQCMEAPDDLWHLSDSNEAIAASFKYPVYPQLAHKFEECIKAIQMLRARYSHAPHCISKDDSVTMSEYQLSVWQHAMVLAHIASKRTDDPKIGVGAVLVYQIRCSFAEFVDGNYGSIGWNGYPEKADILDYPQAGADDIIAHELKYDYILHAEQNALLWRMDPTANLMGSTMVSTKMPCDECSPVLYDSGVLHVVANVQIPKSLDDPARLRGLTYDKIQRLMDSIWVF